MRSRNPFVALLALLAAACGSSEPGATPSLELGGVSHAFGSVPVGTQSQSRRFTLSNMGDGPTGTLAVALSGANAAEFAIVGDDCTGLALQAAASCRIDVRMRPTTLGAKAATLAVSDGGGNSASIALAGTAGPGGIVMVTSSYQFPQTATNASSLPYTFVVQNPGPITAGPLESALAGPQAAHFEITSDTCAGTSLAAGATCAVAIRFRPASSGASAGVLTVSAAAGASTSATLHGVSGEPVVLEFAPASHDFGFALPGSIGSIVLVSVTNQSAVPSSRLTTQLGGTNPSDFSIRANGCLGRELNPGQSCAMEVAFVRLVEGSAAATLEVADQFGGSAVMTLAGSGAGSPTLSPNPSSLAFGRLATGATSAPKPVTITNAGTSATAPISTQVLDCTYYYYYCTPATDFVLTSDGCAGVQLQPGASCVISVAFAPAYRGLVYRQLNVSAGNTTIGITLTGEGAGLVLTPESITFPATPRGTTSEVRHVVVLNGASTATGVLATTVEPSGFEIASDACAGISLAAGASCVIGVQFAPSNTGEHTGMLSVSGDPGGSVSTFLVGQGVP